MRRFITLTGIAATLAASGCAELTPLRLEKITQLAAYTTASQMTDERAKFEAVKNGICELKEQERWDSNALTALADQHGLFELNSTEGQVLLVALELKDLFLDADFDLKDIKYVEALIRGACSGFELALGQGPTPRPVAAGGRRGATDQTLERLTEEAQTTRPSR